MWQGREVSYFRPWYEPQSRVAVEGRISHKTEIAFLHESHILFLLFCHASALIDIIIINSRLHLKLLASSACQTICYFLHRRRDKVTKKTSALLLNLNVVDMGFLYFRFQEEWWMYWFFIDFGAVKNVLIFNFGSLWLIVLIGSRWNFKW